MIQVKLANYTTCIQWEPSKQLLTLLQLPKKHIKFITIYTRKNNSIDLVTICIRPTLSLLLVKCLLEDTSKSTVNTEQLTILL